MESLSQYQFCTCHRRFEPYASHSGQDAYFAPSNARARRPQNLQRARSDSVVPSVTQAGLSGAGNYRAILPASSPDETSSFIPNYYFNGAFDPMSATLLSESSNRSAGRESRIAIAAPLDPAEAHEVRAGDNQPSEDMPNYNQTFDNSSATQLYRFAMAIDKTAPVTSDKSFDLECYSSSTTNTGQDLRQSYETTVIPTILDIESSPVSYESDDYCEDEGGDDPQDLLSLASTFDNNRFVSANSADASLTEQATQITYGLPTTRRKWTKEEDLMLAQAVSRFEHHPQRWKCIAQTIENRSAKLCAKRWKYLESTSKRDIKKGKWAPEEDSAVLEAVAACVGPINWSKIAEALPCPRSAAQVQARYAEKLGPNIKKGWWSPEEVQQLEISVRKHHGQWYKVCQDIPGRTQRQCRMRYLRGLCNSY